MAHNKLRKVHGAQPLLWSEELGDEAQKWCEKLAMNDVLEHDNKTIDYKNEGENLASVNGTSLTTRRASDPLLDLCPKVVQRWYSEEVNYNYKTGMPKANGLSINHFAQVFIWYKVPGRFSYTSKSRLYVAISKAIEHHPFLTWFS